MQFALHAVIAVFHPVRGRDDPFAGGERRRDFGALESIARTHRVSLRDRSLTRNLDDELAACLAVVAGSEQTAEAVFGIGEDVGVAVGLEA